MAAEQRPSAVDVHSQQAGEFAASYEAYDRDPYGSCFTYSRMRLQEALERELPQNAAGLRALDVGCGTGHHLADLARRGFGVAGIDGSSDMLEEARRNNPGVELHQADVAALPFADASFDVVLCVEVLRYLAEPTTCITEMARVLRPGGVCLATAAPRYSVNGYALVNRIALIVPIGELVQLKQHFTTPAQLQHGFEDGGFAPVDVRAVYAGPVNWVEHLSPRRLASFLRWWHRIDAGLVSRPALRGLSNMLLVKAVRAA